EELAVLLGVCENPLAIEFFRPKIMKDVYMLELFGMPSGCALVVRKVVPHRQRASAHASLGAGQCKRNLARIIWIRNAVHDFCAQYHRCSSDIEGATNVIIVSRR